MKKGIIIILSFLIITILFYILNKRQWHKTTLNIVATSQDIQDYLEQPKLVATWFSNFKDSLKTNISLNEIKNSDEKLQIIKANAIISNWNYSYNKKNEEYVFKILPTEDGFTKLEIYYKCNWFQKWFANENLNKVSFIKKYLETPLLRYGIDIYNGKVVDTFLIFTTKKIAKYNLKNELEQSFNNLIKYATTNSLGYNGTRLLHEKYIEKDSAELYTAIGINKMIDTQNEKEMKFAQMPKGNLLIANYDGAFGNRFSAIKKFMEYAKENKYESMALQFEKVNDANFNYKDSQKVNMKICLPVY